MEIQSLSLNGQVAPPSKHKTHTFKKKTFNKPTYCQHCTDLLWGLTNQGVQCLDCKYISHDRCRQKVVTPCQRSGANDNNNEDNCIEDQSECRSEITGHLFKRKTFHKPTYCHYCSDLLWGLKNQGLQCNDCGYATHERCQLQITTLCNFKALRQVQHPKFHSFVKSEMDKKRFCNVCRKAVNDNDLSCQACYYYTHEGCRNRIIHNCKRTSTYSHAVAQLKVKQQHHWSEGHLPNNSKCSACNNACSSNDCLYGLRCTWCATTVHSYCVGRMTEACNFGILRSVLLPPYAVKENNPKCFLPPPSLEQPENSPLTSPERKSSRTDQFQLRVHEGPVDRPVLWREITINKKSTTKDVLSDICNTFNCKEQKTLFYLTIVHKNGVETKLSNGDILTRKVDVANAETKQVFLRHTNLGDKELKITLYAKNIDTSLPSVQMNVNIMVEAKEIVTQAVKLFQLSDTAEANGAHYCITQMKIAPNSVTESPINDTDSLFQVLIGKPAQQGRKEAVGEFHSTRFYLCPREPNTFEALLFVGKLPNDLSPLHYKNLLTDIIGKWDSQSMTMEHTFPVHGAVIIRFKSMASFQRTFTCLQSAKVEEKSVFLKVLPEIKEDMLASNSNPLLLFVNSKSGGGQGAKLMSKFSRMLNPHQIIDLLAEGPLPALYTFRNLRRFRILICGGDGTFGWVLNVLDDIRHQVLKCEEPPSACLPLGTGNDLARVLNWGGGYTGSETCLNVLMNVMTATETMLDRWNLVFDSSSFSENNSSDNINMLPMNNYFSVGIDAAICLEFHLSREENPEKFNNRFHNKGVYVKASLKNMSKSNMANLDERMELCVDGVDVPLPNIEGLCVLNIGSWGAGADCWGKDQDGRFKAQSFGDGLLEVVGFTGVYHMGKIQGGVSTAVRIAQGSQINLLLREDVPVQVDGEPWMQPASLVIIRPNPFSQARMLMKAQQVRSITNAS
ncbi:diacylglycerol kinase theta-like [Clytia hemisphaerica]|uniref:Diacylglycerol kinase n=1 Tax=Clytia hemisphaerica TaxID=252671 RepID=A0A7M5XGC0_9CNID|eukprot:TCONS_00004921-protein